MGLRGISMYIGEKVGFRAYAKEDTKLAHEYISDADVKRNLTPDIPYPITLHEEEMWIENQSAFKTEYSFAIEILQSGEYIGGCGVNKVDWKNSIAEIGIFLGKKFWGKGYGSDGMNLLIKFVFEQMNINKVKLNVYSFNKRAIRCYEKLGFKLEGVLRQELFRDGQYHDIHIMGILKDEYFKKTC